MATILKLLHRNLKITINNMFKNLVENRIYGEQKRQFISNMELSRQLNINVRYIVSLKIIEFHL